MKIIDCEQGSTAWSQARLGVVTASEIDALVTPLWKIRTGEGVETYLHKKLAEKLLNYPQDSGTSYAMDQGSIVEKIALPWFEFQYDTTVRRVGFCLSDDGRTGCSPDGLIGDDMGLEVKSPQPATHLKYLLRGEVPPEYLPQIHFSMLVTGRPRWTFVSFSRQFPPLVVPVMQDKQIQQVLQGAVDLFAQKFDAALARINALNPQQP